MEAASGIEPENDGFANHCLTAWLRRLVWGERILYPLPSTGQGKRHNESFDKQEQAEHNTIRTVFTNEGIAERLNGKGLFWRTREKPR